MTSGLPLRVTWELDGIVFNGPPDAAGREWIVTAESGWSGSAPKRTSRTPRLWADGSSRGRAFRDERVIRLDGIVACPTWESRRDAEHRLAALCAGTALYPLVCNEENGSWVSWVELDDAVMVSIVPGGFELEFSIQLAAPDPRRFSVAESSVSALLPVPPATSPATVTLTNTGNAPAPLLIRVDGPLSTSFSVTCWDTSDAPSKWFTYVPPAAMGASESVTFDTDRRTAYTGSGIDVRRFMNNPPEWHLAQPGLVTTVRLVYSGTYDARTRLTVRWRHTRH